MAKTDYNFGRVVKLHFVSKKPNAKGEQEVVGNASIVFDPKTDRQLCPRIDFWVQGKGTEFTGTGDFFKTARIDLYNIGPALNKVLSVYETIVNDVWNVENCEVQVRLEVGYQGKALTTIFNGKVGSYNVERVQNETTVDNIWHLFCQSDFSSPAKVIDDNEKALLTTDDFLDPNFSKPVAYGIEVETNGDQALRSAFISHPRDILVWHGGITEEDSYTETERVKIEEKDFDRYCEIQYVRGKGLATKDYDLEYNFKNKLNYVWQPIPENLDDAISMITKRLGNYSYIIEPPEEPDERYIIKIYKQTTAVLAEEKAGKHWIINNFENLTKAPTITGGTLQLSMIMEPSMRTFDSVELRVDEKFNKTASFEFNFNQASAGAMTNFAGTNVIGLSQTGIKTANISDAEARGNIFYRRFSVLFIEHQGSTHNNTWQTNACCSCPVK